MSNWSNWNLGDKNILEGGDLPWMVPWVESEKSVLLSAVAVFKGIYSHLKNQSGYRRFYLVSDACRYIIMTSLSS